jgi:hypothetical protein
MNRHWYRMSIVLPESLTPTDHPVNGWWPATVCWGMLYPLSRRQPDGSTLQRPEPPTPGKGIIAQRSIYLHGLHELILRARGDRYALLALTWELQEWLRLDAKRTNRIWQNLSPLMLDPLERHKHRDEHWLWEGVLTGGKPVCSFGAAKNVPVSRLLWTTERPEVSLVGKRGEALRPRRNKNVCTSMMCQNPHHFELAQPTRVGRSLTGTASGNFSSTGDRMPPRNFHWSINSRWKPDETGVFARLVLCTSGHPLGPTAQIKYNAALKGGSPTSGKGHCPECFKFRRKHGMNVPLRPYRGQPITASDERQTQGWLSQAEPAPTRPRIPPDLFTEDEDASINVHGPYDFFAEDNPA